MSSSYFPAESHPFCPFVQNTCTLDLSCPVHTRYSETCSPPGAPAMFLPDLPLFLVKAQVAIATREAGKLDGMEGAAFGPRNPRSIAAPHDSTLPPM
jgi:hypothetical protein